MITWWPLQGFPLPPGGKALTPIIGFGWNTRIATHVIPFSWHFFWYSALVPIIQARFETPRKGKARCGSQEATSKSQRGSQTWLAEPPHLHQGRSRLNVEYWGGGGGLENTCPNLAFRLKEYRNDNGSASIEHAITNSVLANPSSCGFLLLKVQLHSPRVVPTYLLWSLLQKNSL